MKPTLILFLALVALCHSKPLPQNQLQSSVPYILRYFFDNAGFGGFSFGVETSDGFKHDQKGEIKNEGTDNEALSVAGEYEYIGDNGQTYNVKYTADENGFQPEGEHIPPSAGVKKLGIPSAALASLGG